MVPVRAFRSAVAILAFSALHVVDATAQSTPGALQAILKLPAPGSFNDIAISPNGRFVLRAREGGIDVIEVATARVRELSTGGSIASPAWAPRGDRVVWSRWDGEPRRPTVWTLAVDPATATPRGLPQRVSIGSGDVPAVSFDGASIAYATFPEGTPRDANVPQRRIVVVPANGGPERTVANTAQGMETLFWSKDGQSLFAGSGGSPDSQYAALTRISVADGAVRVLSRDSAWVAGASADRGFFVLVSFGMVASANANATVVDAEGRRIGSVRIPPGQRIFYGGVRGDSALVMVRWEDQWGLQTKSLGGGASRALPILGRSNVVPRYSPDGKSLAFAVDVMGARHLAIARADGSNIRELPEVRLRTDVFAFFWSPDARTIAYQTPDRSDLRLLDVASGSTRSLLKGTPMGMLQWHPDGKGLVTYVGNRGLQSVMLDGTVRMHMPMSEVAGFHGGVLRTTTRGFLVRGDSSMSIYPYDGGAPTRTSGLPAASVQSTGAVSADGQTLVHLYRTKPVAKLELFSLATMQRRTIDLPFALGPGHDPAFALGDRVVLVLGYRPNDTGNHVFAVPVDGSRPYEVGAVNSFQPYASFSVSADGKSVIFASQRVAERSVVLLDLRAALKGANSVTTGN